MHSSVQHTTAHHYTERVQCVSASARNGADCLVSENVLFSRMATLLFVYGSVLPWGKTPFWRHLAFVFTVYVGLMDIRPTRWRFGPGIQCRTLLFECLDLTLKKEFKKTFPTYSINFYFFMYSTYMATLYGCIYRHPTAE